MAQISPTSSDQKSAGARAVNGRASVLTAARVMAWPRRWRYARQDAQVNEWKAAWRAGAHARWAGARIQDMPYDGKSSRQSAWMAGWRWAEHHPDRRTNRAVRLAHPLRRATDAPAVLVRRGALGLSLFAALGWIWRGVWLRRPRPVK